MCLTPCPLFWGKVTKPILEFLDNTYANIQNLSGYKRDIALFALGRGCLIRACFGEFARSKKSLTAPVTDERGRYPNTHLGNPSLASFKDMFVECIRDANALVFDNGQECRATNQEALDLLNGTVPAKAGLDLVYADPPYITQFSYNDYEDKLHFVEGLMTCWEGKEIRDNPRRNFPSRTKYDRESIGRLIEGFIDGTALLMIGRAEAVGFRSDSGGGNSWPQSGQWRNPAKITDRHCGQVLTGASPFPLREGS